MKTNKNKIFIRANVSDTRILYIRWQWIKLEYEIKEWSSQYIFQFKQLERRSLKKNSGLNGTRTHDLCDTGAVLYQLSYQANWELVTLWVRNIPIDGEECKWIYEISYSWTAEKDMKTWLIIAIKTRQPEKIHLWPAPSWLDIIKE